MIDPGTDEATRPGASRSPTAGAGAPDDLLRRWRWLLYAATGLPFLTAAIRAITNDWFPIGDSALLYLRMADVGTEHHPLLGSWSSASLSLGRNINNPGPLYDDLMAPFARLLPTGPGNVIGVTVLNLGFVVLAALAARRIGGPRYEAWTLLTATALAWTMGSEVLFDTFQAHALLLPFLSALVLLTGAMTGHRWTWPWLVFVWSVILQTHISYAYIAVVVVAAAFAVALPAIPRPRGAWLRERVRSRAVLWSGVVAVAAWVQPVIEQFTADGEGNLTRLLKSAGGTDVAVGFGNAFRMVAAVFALPPWWTRWGFADTIQPAGAIDTPAGRRVDIPWLPAWPVATVALVVLVALLVVATWWTSRERFRLLHAVNVLALGGTVGSVVALGRLTVGSVGLAAHHTRWLFVLALWAHAALAATGVRRLLAVSWSRPAAVRRAVDAAVVVAVVVVAVANVPKYTQLHGPLADTDTMPALRRVFATLAPLDDVDPFLYRTDNLRVYEPYSSAIMAQLVDRGIEFRVDQEVMVRQLGPSRRADGSESATVSQYQGWEAYAYDGPECVLARVSDLDVGTEQELARTAAGLEDRVMALDVSAVPLDPAMTERDAVLAEAIMAGDRDAVHRAIVEGWYGWWIDHGLVDGDPSTVEELLDVRPPMMHWVGTTFVLTVDPPTACG